MLTLGNIPLFPYTYMEHVSRKVYCQFDAALIELTKYPSMAAHVPLLLPLSGRSICIHELISTLNTHLRSWF